MTDDGHRRAGRRHRTRRPGGRTIAAHRGAAVAQRRIGGPPRPRHASRPHHYACTEVPLLSLYKKAKQFVSAPFTRSKQAPVNELELFYRRLPEYIRPKPLKSGELPIPRFSIDLSFDNGLALRCNRCLHRWRVHGPHSRKRLYGASRCPSCYARLLGTRPGKLPGGRDKLRSDEPLPRLGDWEDEDFNLVQDNYVPGEEITSE